MLETVRMTTKTILNRLKEKNPIDGGYIQFVSSSDTPRDLSVAEYIEVYLHKNELINKLTDSSDAWEINLQIFIRL